MGITCRAAAAQGPCAARAIWLAIRVWTRSSSSTRSSRPSSSLRTAHAVARGSSRSSPSSRSSTCACAPRCPLRRDGRREEGRLPRGREGRQVRLARHRRRRPSLRVDDGRRYRRRLATDAHPSRPFPCPPAPEHSARPDYCNIATAPLLILIQRRAAGAARRPASRRPRPALRTRRLPAGSAAALGAVVQRARAVERLAHILLRGGELARNVADDDAWTRRSRSARRSSPSADADAFICRSACAFTSACALRGGRALRRRGRSLRRSEVYSPLCAAAPPAVKGSRPPAPPVPPG